MININGKDYEVNDDLKIKTEKFIAFCVKNPAHEKVGDYTELILKDMLIPSPSHKEIIEFRKSDVEKVFTEYQRKTEEYNKELKKKLST